LLHRRDAAHDPRGDGRAPVGGRCADRWLVLLPAPSARRPAGLSQRLRVPQTRTRHDRPGTRTIRYRSGAVVRDWRQDGRHRGGSPRGHARHPRANRLRRGDLGVARRSGARCRARGRGPDGRNVLGDGRRSRVAEHAMTTVTRRYRDIVNGFDRVRVAVAGDLIADEFIYGRIERVSREAPVQILGYDSAEVLPGGAGNAARNAASLGASVLLVGLVGRDPAGRGLYKTLEATADVAGV